MKNIKKKKEVEVEEENKHIKNSYFCERSMWYTNRRITNIFMRMRIWIRIASILYMSYQIHMNIKVAFLLKSFVFVMRTLCRSFIFIIWWCAHIFFTIFQSGRSRGFVSLRQDKLFGLFAFVADFRFSFSLLFSFDSEIDILYENGEDNKEKSKPIELYHSSQMINCCLE